MSDTNSNYYVNGGTKGYEHGDTMPGGPAGAYQREDHGYHGKLVGQALDEARQAGVSGLGHEDLAGDSGDPNHTTLSSARSNGHSEESVSDGEGHRAASQPEGQDSGDPGARPKNGQGSSYSNGGQ